MEQNCNQSIPKADPRDPLCYRGIALAYASYKLYCNILNERLAQWVDDNNLLADEQNGFRKGCSTIDQLFTLTKTPFTLTNLDRSWMRSVLKRSILGKCKRLKSIFNRT